MTANRKRDRSELRARIGARILQRRLQRWRLFRHATVTSNGYGGLLVRAGDWFYAQKSGHGHWCGIGVGRFPQPRAYRFEAWLCSHTGKLNHAFMRRMSSYAKLRP